MKTFKNIELYKKQYNNIDINNKVFIYEYCFTKEIVIAVFDKSKIYDIEFGNGQHDLIKIYGTEGAHTIHCESILKRKTPFLSKYKIDILSILKNNKIKETYYQEY